MTKCKGHTELKLGKIPRLAYLPPRGICWQTRWLCPDSQRQKLHIVSLRVSILRLEAEVKVVQCGKGEDPFIRGYEAAQWTDQSSVPELIDHSDDTDEEDG